MAAGFDSSVQMASDVFYDYMCSSCEENGKNSEATYFCAKCSKQYCDTCIKMHKQLLRDHQVLTRKDLAKWNTVRKPVTMDMCTEHSDKELEMFCKDHDEICCLVCVGVKHRLCKTVDHVPNVAKGIHKNPEFKMLLTNTPNVQTKLSNMTEKKKKTRKALQDSCKETLSTFRDSRRRIDKLLDDIEKRTVAEMDRLLAMFDAEIESDIDSCTRVNADITKHLDDVNGKGKTNESVAFSGFKKCQAKMNEAENLLKEMSQKPDAEIKFAPDLEIENILSNTELMGAFQTTVATAMGGLSVHKHGHGYVVDNIQKYNVKIPSDTALRCEIRCCCKMPNGQIVLADASNRKVKLLNSLYGVVAHCDLPATPVGMCIVTDTEVALTLNNGTFQFISVMNDKLNIVRSKRLSGSGLVYHNNQFYIATDTGIHAYNRDGDLVERKVKDIKSLVFSMASSANNKTVFASRYNENAILIFDLGGTKSQQFTDQELRKPVGLCVAENGNLFVTGQASNTVVQVDPQSNKKVSTIKQEITRPEGIWFDNKTCELIVGQLDDNILVIKMK